MAQSKAVETSSSPRRTNDIVVDPSLAAIIGDPQEPVGPVPLVEPPADMPGRSGFVWGLHSVYGYMRHGVDYLLDSRERFGDVFKSPFMEGAGVVVWDADEIQKILKNDDQVWSAALGWDALAFDGIDMHAKNAGTLLSRDFDAHRAARKLVQPAFSQAALKGYGNMAQRSFDRAIARWVDEGRVDFKREIRTLLASVASQIFTGIVGERVRTRESERAG